MIMTRKFHANFISLDTFIRKLPVWRVSGMLRIGVFNNFGHLAYVTFRSRGFDPWNTMKLLIFRFWDKPAIKLYLKSFSWVEWIWWYVYLINFYVILQTGYSHSQSHEIVRYTCTSNPLRFHPEIKIFAIFMRLDNFINLQHQILLREPKKTVATEKQLLDQNQKFWP